MPSAFDYFVAAILSPLAIWILLNELDDLVILGAFLVHRRKFRLPEGNGEAPARLMAIYVPCWHEDGVIAGMLEHNTAAVRYPRYHFFVGAYPNDPATQNAVLEVARRHPNVHLALAPHDGPTSKADCLNWVYQNMLAYEMRTGERFDVILTHDAEDIIHPDSLTWISRLMDDYGMIQTPVLALATPWSQWTHGIYCDDFAEFHTKDLPARNLLGGFIPSSGVGTAYRREALEKLAESESNRIFAPDCLTEDYENGLRLARLGVRQLFLPIQWIDGKPMAIREFFPQKFHAAYRQRTRWITGIALQGWEHHGWLGKRKRLGGQAGESEGSLGVLYWFWRDRKGLLGNPLSLVANLLFVYGIGTWLVSRAWGVEWGLAGAAAGSIAVTLLPWTAGLGLVHAAARVWCSAGIYGWKFAALSPLRSVLGNVLNTASTVSAVARYAHARWHGKPLRWLKTEHAYPSLAALNSHKRLLGEVLVGAGYVTEEQLTEAVKTAREGMRLGERLVEMGVLSAEDLIEALSLQSNVAAEWVEPESVPVALGRSLPAAVMERLGVVPVRLELGALHLAGCDLPTDNAQQELAGFTRLRLRFVLVTPENYRRLSRRMAREPAKTA